MIVKQHFHMRIVGIVFILLFSAVTVTYSQETCKKCKKVADKLTGSWSTYKIIIDINGSEAVAKQDVIPADTLTLFADATFKIVTEEPKMVKGEWKVQDRGKLLVLTLQEADPRLQNELPEWKLPISHISRNRLTLQKKFNVRTTLGKLFNIPDNLVSNGRVFYQRLGE